MILSSTYHVFEFYSPHHVGTLIPVSLSSDDYQYGEQAIPAVSASNSKNNEETVPVTMTNVDPSVWRTVMTGVRGYGVSQVTGRILTAEVMNAHNTFEQPSAVAPEPSTGAELTEQALRIVLPPKSIVVLTLE